MQTEQPTKCFVPETEGEVGPVKLVYAYLPFQGDSSVVVLCCLFLVSEFRWLFTLCLYIILLVWLVLLSGHLLGKSCPLGWPCVLIIFCLFVILVISRYGIEGGVWFLVEPVPVHCLLVTFIQYQNTILRALRKHAHVIYFNFSRM